MTWLLGLLTGNWKWLVGALGAVVAALAVRKSGSDAVLVKQAKVAAKRSDAGRKAQGTAAGDIAKGKTPEQVLRDNDGRWQ